MPAWTQPRAAPPALLPAVAGAIVIVLALPIFLIAGWPVEGWALGRSPVVRVRSARPGTDAAADPDG